MPATALILLRRRLRVSIWTACFGCDAANERMASSADLKPSRQINSQKTQDFVFSKTLEQVLKVTDLLTAGRRFRYGRA